MGFHVFDGSDALTDDCAKLGPELPGSSAIENIEVVAIEITISGRRHGHPSGSRPWRHHHLLANLHDVSLDAILGVLRPQRFKANRAAGIGWSDADVLPQRTE